MMLRGAVKLFTVRGIEIRADYSWFIVLALVTWSFAGQAYPEEFKAPLAIYILLGFTTSVVLFLSVLLHELAHSFVAMSHGIRVPPITLFIFGAAAQIETEPKKAPDEFLMALAGPAASVALAALYGALWLLFRGDLIEQGGIPPLASFFRWLAYINLFLAFFNLLPGFPLDGGRVFRSIVWGITKDLGKATRIAAAVGRGVAVFFIFLGIWMVFRGAIFNGIWFAFIGWFLMQAATSSSRQQVLKDLLAGHTAGEVMWRDCPFIDARTTVSELVYNQIMRTGRRCFPVTADGNVSGIVTIHNIKALDQAQWPNTAVAAIMTPAQTLKTVAPETPLNRVMEMVGADGVNQVPVVKEGKFIGMVTREAIMDFLRARNELGLPQSPQPAAAP
jgi:Zn-dependent protease/CBS domain-containing protein